MVAAHHKLAATERLMGAKLGEPEQWKRYDSEFHQALISNCGSRALMAEHAAVFDRYFRYQMIALNYRGDEPALQHQAVLECALERDCVREKSVLIDHVTGCVAHALAIGNTALA